MMMIHDDCLLYLDRCWWWWVEHRRLFFFKRAVDYYVACCRCTHVKVCCRIIIFFNHLVVFVENACTRTCHKLHLDLPRLIVMSSIVEAASGTNDAALFLCGKGALQLIVKFCHKPRVRHASSSSFSSGGSATFTTIFSNVVVTAACYSVVVAINFRQCIVVGDNQTSILKITYRLPLITA